MSGFVIKLLTTWQFVLKRGLANWKLMSSVLLGVLLASAIMSSPSELCSFSDVMALAVEAGASSATASTAGGSKRRSCGYLRFVQNFEG